MCLESVSSALQTLHAIYKEYGLRNITYKTQDLYIICIYLDEFYSKRPCLALRLGTVLILVGLSNYFKIAQVIYYSTALLSHSSCTRMCSAQRSATAWRLSGLCSQRLGEYSPCQRSRPAGGRSSARITSSCPARPAWMMTSRRIWWVIITSISTNQ